MNLSCGIFATSSGERKELFKKLQEWERAVSVILHHCWLEKEWVFSHSLPNVCYHKTLKVEGMFSATIANPLFLLNRVLARQLSVGFELFFI